MADMRSIFICWATTKPMGIKATTGLIRTPVAPRNAKQSITMGIAIRALSFRRLMATARPLVMAPVSLTILKYPPIRVTKKIVE